MAIELWRWQYGLESEMWATAVLSDGYPVIAGNVRHGLDDDFLAIKLDPLSGGVLWTWEEGTAGGDRILGAAAAEDGTVILAGYTEGNWAVNNQGDSDFAAVKLDSSGDIVWYWQEGTAASESLTSVAVGEDGSVVMGGYSSDDSVMVKLDAYGNKLWNWTGDSGGSEYGNTVGMLENDGSAVLAGSTSGTWDGENASSVDFAAVNIDTEDKAVWRWQEGSALKDDTVTATAMARDGFVVVAGYSEGGLAGTNKGKDDFFAAKIDPNSGRRLWLWQDGTEKNDRVQAMAATPHGAMVLTGSTAGSFAGNNTLSSLQGVAVMLETSAIVTKVRTVSLASNSTSDTLSNISTSAPSTTPIPAPTLAPTTVPTPAPLRPGTTRAPVPTMAPTLDITLAPTTVPTPAPLRPGTTRAPVPTMAPTLNITLAPASNTDTGQSGSGQPDSDSSSSSANTLIVAVVLSIIAVAVVAAIFVYIWRNTEGLGWLRGKQGPTVIPAKETEHGDMGARPRDLGGEDNT